jgi:hypothetical protein
VQGIASAATGAAKAKVDLSAVFTPADKGSNEEGAAFLQKYLQQRLWAQDGDDAGERFPVLCGYIAWFTVLRCMVASATLCWYTVDKVFQKS